MRYLLLKSLFVLMLATTIASCSSSRKQTGSNGKVIILEDGRNARAGGSAKDNGLHKGWYKNTNNPHYPNTTNPGHTKKKGSATSKKQPGKAKGKKG
ncbi:hypothetical protein FVR03_22560 [Pontibacter qinzhouensis]|uniref:Lipoprotein n=1 Tax=Pontibacter qinzhouensis TaxID=2603253 RepID=A0A5C8IQM5_9BACT|nr:hypothetical protein [Pontibacter qinzhouensis]TXK23461.1 hypothetical protein FVR03_22560 [Pontibacter qinzhouensis]